MKRMIYLWKHCCALASVALLTNCGAKVQADPKAEAPPPVPVEQVTDVNLVKVDHPEKFPIATAASFSAAPGTKRYRHGEPGRVAPGSGDLAWRRAGSYRF